MHGLTGFRLPARLPDAIAGSPGRVVVITGASSGIGRCTAALFARHGWRVGLLARGEAGLAAIHAELSIQGAAAAAAAADVADDVVLDRAADWLAKQLGPPDVWVNCAGNGVFGGFLDVPAAAFRRVTEVTYLGTVNGTRTALRSMVPRDAGVVVNICSAIAFHGLPVLSSYSGAKHAVHGFTQSVRHELIGAGSRVRLAIIYPPAVNTPFFSHSPTHLPGTPRPARPVYQPELVADAVLLAATTRRREIRVSGVTVLFALCCRLVPGLIHHAIQRLGAAGQTTGAPEAARRYAPTLEAPSLQAAGAHGPFDAESRGWSTQMWLARHPAAALLAVAAAGLAITAWWW